MAKITREAAKERIAELTSTLKEANRNYYVLNAPTMSDFEFDTMLQELQALEKLYPDLALPDSPSQKVGSDLENMAPGSPLKEFAQYPHRYPMLSLGNTYNLEDMYEFHRKIKELVSVPFSYSAELKFDGAGICLTYRDGILVRALTRGDGHIGDDVTANVKTIKAIPSVLHSDGRWPVPKEFEIRGEIFMPYAAFDRLNAERDEDGDQLFANPRNAAAGSLKMLDPEIVATRGLDSIQYHMLGEGLPYASHDEMMQAAASWGIPTGKYSKICHRIEDVIEYIRFWDTERKKLPFPTDGVVIKVNELALRTQLGYTSKIPRWATAYKFKPEQACTRLYSIDYQVGRTGKVTPVANLDPVQLSGTVVKRATLHNADQMDALDIHIDDYVYVEKGGEIIPKITGVEMSKRLPGAEKPVFPKVCPDCGTPLAKDEDEAAWYCPNDACPTQIKSRFIHFCSRHAMNILAGDATIDQLFKKGYILHLSDMYDLTKEQLLTLDGWKDLSAERFLKSIENSKKAPFSAVLFALGIRHIGENTAKVLASHFKSVQALAAASEQELDEMDEIGPVLSRSIREYFADARHIVLINRLKADGLRFEQEEEQKISDILAGKTVVVTGTYSIPRDAMKKLISQNGGKNTSSVSASTSYLLTGTKPGPDKVKKAEKLGVKMMTEEEFHSLINDGH
jgi:DNA ligase, NAD-dependent